MPTHATIDRATFLTHLRQSGLLTPEQVAQVVPSLPPGEDTRALALHLVGQGVLTRFQAARLLLGRTSGYVLGQYRVLAHIGRGGMGRVYKAEHRTMGRVVALKVLPDDLLNTDRAAQLFLHEVRAAAQLVHPNIVAAFDANQVDGRYFLVLEYVDGPNLDQLVRKQGPLPVGLACDYVRQVADGLQCAHLRGMVHRDVKPANILVQWHGLDGDASPGLVKVSDFGLARLHAPAGGGLLQSTPGTILTNDDAVMGTPDYLSPEQSRDLHKVDIRSDLYSLGCTFYFLLTGQVPFPGGSSLDKLIRHSTVNPTPIPEFRDDVPEAVVAIVNRLMAKRRTDRFQTPAELAAALQPYAVSGPTPWDRSRPAPAPGAEAQATPADGFFTDAEVEPPSVEVVALEPEPPPILPRPPRPPRDRYAGLKVVVAVLLAVGLVSAALWVLTALSLLSGR